MYSQIKAEIFISIFRVQSFSYGCGLVSVYQRGIRAVIFVLTHSTMQSAHKHPYVRTIKTISCPGVWTPKKKSRKKQAETRKRNKPKYHFDLS